MFHVEVDPLTKNADLSEEGLMRSSNSALALGAIRWCIPGAECARSLLLLLV